MSICILDPGPLTTVQDLGRAGLAAQGCRTCGAADGYSARLANLLVGNAPSDAVLETTLRGPELRFEIAAVFALAGAEAPAALDGVSVPFYAPLFAPAGSVLKIAAARTGLRSYLAVWGGIPVPQVRGSRATDLACCLGGFQGRALRKGDVLPTAMPGDTAAAWWKTIRRRKADRPLGDAAARSGCRLWRWEQDMQLPLLRAVPGPQWDAFAPEGQAAFTHGIYRLTADCDRMACKLQGPAIQTVHGADILSDGIVEGSVQVGGERPAHRYAGRPPDHRRLRQDRHRHQRRPACPGPAAPRAGGGLYPYRPHPRGGGRPRPGCLPAAGGRPAEP